MKSLELSNRLRIAAMLAVVIIGLGAGMWNILAQDGAVNPTSQSLEVGPLDYPVDKEALGNPWLIAAAGNWPSMASAEISKYAVTPSAEERKHFEKWVQGTIGAQWLPQDFQDVPFLADKGFVHVKQSDDYRVRIREAQKPAYEGSSIMTKAIVMAVEPLAKQIPVLETPNEMLSFVEQFLHPDATVDAERVQFITPTETIVVPGNVKLPPIYKEVAGGMLICLWPAKFPVDSVIPYAWTDGKILLIALYEDVHYGEGPTPEPQVNPTPPPSGEE